MVQNGKRFGGWLGKQVKKPFSYAKEELEYRAKKKKTYRQAYREAEISQLGMEARKAAQLASKRRLALAKRGKTSTKTQRVRGTISNVGGVVSQVGGIAEPMAFYDAIGYKPASKPKEKKYNIKRKTTKRRKPRVTQKGKQIVIRY